MPATVTPVSGALGNKEAATLTAYTVTPEAGSTVTQIVEKVNGVTVNTFNNPASLSRTLTVPTATWDTLAYFTTHTASITVTDSNGATTVTTYSFDKRLATNASLLEATKANTDAKNRISQKRDALAAQVGLSAGSTFDAISAQLASGAVFKKFVPGVSTSTAGGNVTVNTLNFKPLLVFIHRDNGNGLYRDVALITSLINSTTNLVIDSGGTYFIGSSSALNDNGFSIRVGTGNASYSWVAFG